MHFICPRFHWAISGIDDGFNFVVLEPWIPSFWSNLVYFGLFVYTLHHFCPLLGKMYEQIGCFGKLGRQSCIFICHLIPNNAKYQKLMMIFMNLYPYKISKLLTSKFSSKPVITTLNVSGHRILFLF